MTRTRVLRWALVLGCVFAASAWAQEAAPAPFEVVEAFVEACNSGDLEGARSLVVPEMHVARYSLYWDFLDLDGWPDLRAHATARGDRYEVELVSVYGDRTVLTRDRYWVGGRRQAAAATTLWVVWAGRIVGKTSVFDADAANDAFMAARSDGTWHAPGGGPVAYLHIGRGRFAFAEELDALADPHDRGAIFTQGDEATMNSDAGSRLCKMGARLWVFVRFVDMHTLELVPRGDECSDRWPGSETLRYERVTRP